MVELHVSRPEELAAQKELWRCAFGDEDRYIDWFYTCCGTADTLVLREDGKLASMLALLPVELSLPGGARASSSYIYALATDPDARKKGYGRQLLHYVDAYLRERGTDCVTVVPAEPSLHKFFGTVDFAPCFSLRKLELMRDMVAQPSAGDTIQAAEPEEYSRLRASYLAETPAVLYPDSLIRYQQGLSQMGRGGLFRVVVGGVAGCVVAEYVDEDSLLLKELLIPPAQMMGAVALVASQLPALRYHVRTPAGWDGLPGSYHQAFAMVKWYNHEKEVLWGLDTHGYMGLGFD